MTDRTNDHDPSGLSGERGSLAALDRLDALVSRLERLVERQRRAIEDRDAAVMRSVAEERGEALRVLERSRAEVDATLTALAAGTLGTREDRAHAASIGLRLEAVLECDQEDIERLRVGVEEVGRDLDHARDGRRATNAYAPHVPDGSTSRFADRKA